MNGLKLLLLAGAVTLAATSALIASAAPHGKFANADVNKDNALTQTEACSGKTRRICKNFAAMDANKDGAVTRSEVRAYKKAKRAAKGLPVKP